MHCFIHLHRVGVGVLVVLLLGCWLPAVPCGALGTTDSPDNSDADMPSRPLWFYQHTRNKPSPMEARGGHSTSIMLSKLFIFGGCADRDCYNDMIIFDLDSMKWARPGPVDQQAPPSRRVGHTATVMGRSIIFFGGYSRSSARYMNDLWKFDTGTYTWQIVNSVGTPEPRCEHTATLLDNKKILFFGGFNENAFFNDVNVYDVENNKWYLENPVGVKPFAREGHTTTQSGDKLYVFGGYTGTTCLNDIQVLNMRAMQWYMPTTGGSPPPARQDHTSALFKGMIYVWGGCNYQQQVCYNSLYRFDIGLAMWQMLEVDGFSQPVARDAHTLTLDGSRLVLLGGCIMDTGGCFDDVYMLELEPCPNRCSGHGSCGMRDGICKCFSNYRDKDCSDYYIAAPGESDPPCPRHCNYRGDCVDGKCVCDMNWKSYDCSVADYEEVSVPTDCGKDVACIQERKAMMAAELERQEALQELRRVKEEQAELKVQRDRVENVTKIADQIKEQERQVAMAGPRIFIKNKARGGDSRRGGGGGGGGGGGSGNAQGPPGQSPDDDDDDSDKKSRAQLEAEQQRRDELAARGIKIKPGCPLPDPCDDDEDEIVNKTKRGGLNKTQLVWGEEAGMMVNGTNLRKPGATWEYKTRKEVLKWSRNMSAAYMNKTDQDIERYPPAGSFPINTKCKLDCSQNGRCMRAKKGSADWVCRCIPGWRGVACEIDMEEEARKLAEAELKKNPFDRQRTTPCPNHCSGHGVCDHGHCVCDSGYSGFDCGKEYGGSTLKGQKFQIGRWPLVFVGIILLIILLLALLGALFENIIDDKNNMQRANVGSAEDQRRLKMQKQRKKDKENQVFKSWRWRSIHMHRCDKNKVYAVPNDKNIQKLDTAAEARARREAKAKAKEDAENAGLTGGNISQLSSLLL